MSSTPKTKNHRVGIRQLQETGLPIVSGRSYVRKEWLPKRRLSIEALHRKMAILRGSLADEIARAREEG